jgi:hypothetical protein
MKDPRSIYILTISERIAFPYSLIYTRNNGYQQEVNTPPNEETIKKELALIDFLNSFISILIEH